jgi:hypothetical protein
MYVVWCIFQRISSRCYSTVDFGYTYIHLNTEDDHFLKREYLGLIRPMVPVACMFGAVVRGTIEGV